MKPIPVNDTELFSFNLLSNRTVIHYLKKMGFIEF